MQKSISNPQIQKIHILLKDLGLLDDKKEYIEHFTNGRKSSTKELTMQEATCLIQLLCERDPKETQKKAIIALAYMAAIIYGNSFEDYKMNDAKLDTFLKERGTVKKDLKKMTLDELKQVHRQFEAIVKNNRKAKDNKMAKTVTDKLLLELNIPTN